MRLLKIGVYPPTYLQNFYARRPTLAAQSYAAQHRTLIGDCFGSADFWTRELNGLGWETCDIIANAELLQTRWAAENDFFFDSNDSRFTVAAAQIKSFRPDVLLIADYSTIDAEFIRRIRRECRSIRLVVGWCGAPYQDLSNIREWNIALSCVPEMVADFRRENIESFHVNHAFAPRILEKIDTQTPPSVDFAFSGSILKMNRFHVERERLLIELVEKTNLQIWSDIAHPTARERRDFALRRRAHKTVRAARNAGVPEKLLTKLPLVRKVAGWNAPPDLNQYLDERIRRRTHAPLFGLEMFGKLRDSRVVFNNHIDISPFSASNMRLFEATGAGACLITDWKQNIGELFTPDEEILTYRTAAECAEKVNYLLAHETERAAIAAAGQRRTLREHTFADRAARLDEIIRRSLNLHD